MTDPTKLSDRDSIAKLLHEKFGGPIADFYKAADMLVAEGFARPALSGDTPAEPKAWLCRLRSENGSMDYEITSSEPLYLHPAPAAVPQRRLMEIIERERTSAFHWIEAARKTVGRHRWVTQTRGSYAWDDDEFFKEALHLFKALDGLLERAEKETHARDLTDSILPALAVSADTPVEPEILEGEGGCVICTHCEEIICYMSYEERAKAWDYLRSHDLTCDKNPLVIKLRELDSDVRRLEAKAESNIISLAMEWYRVPEQDDVNGIAAAIALHEACGALSQYRAKYPRDTEKGGSPDGSR